MLSQRVGAPAFCCVVFHRVNAPQFFDSLIYWWHLGYFQHLAIINNAMNIGVHRFFWIGDLGIVPPVGSLVWKAVPALVFWGNSILFSTVAAPFENVRKDNCRQRGPVWRPQTGLKCVCSKEHEDQCGWCKASCVGWGDQRGGQCSKSAGSWKPQ